MTWQEAIATVFICLGLAAGAFVFARRPSFWIEFGWRLFARVRPVIWAYLSKRMTPEEEEDYRRAYRAGRGDEWLRDRTRRKRKG